MLSRLMAIKRRREQNARQQVAEINVKLQDLEMKKSTLWQEQKLHRVAWQANNTRSHNVGEHQMQVTHESLNSWYHQDIILNENQQLVKKQIVELKAKQIEQKKILVKARIDQEKLAWLLGQTQ